MKHKTYFSLFCVLFLLLSGCQKSGLGGSENRPTVESTELQFLPLAAGDMFATVKTSKGDIVVALYPQHAPQAVENFRLLAESDYYDNTIFHRVVAGFIIQGGDDTGTGKGGKSAWGEPFRSEFTDYLHHYSGALCTATPNDLPNQNQSQFYILATPANGWSNAEAMENMQNAGLRSAVADAYSQAGGAPYLDNKDTVFGQVIEGMDVVDAIAKAAANASGLPKSEITLLDITIEFMPDSSASSLPA